MLLVVVLKLSCVILPIACCSMTVSRNNKILNIMMSFNSLRTTELWLTIALTLIRICAAMFGVLRGDSAVIL